MASLVRRALAEVCTVSVLLVFNFLRPNFIIAAIFISAIAYTRASLSPGAPSATAELESPTRDRTNHFVNVYATEMR